MVDAARITVRMMRIASTGGLPGSSPNTNTRTATPTPPQMPRATPLDFVPMTIAPITTSASTANNSPSTFDLLVLVRVALRVDQLFDALRSVLGASKSSSTSGAHVA